MLSTLRKIASPLRLTPLHPQWFALREQKHLASLLKPHLRGLILDIGCGDQWPRRLIDPQAGYIGLDYYRTATEWYGTRPQVYADAARLPFPPHSFDCALILDVLEHLPDPAQSLAEVARVLKTGGTVLVQVPFLYPLHDAPRDYRRWTLHGLRELAQVSQLVVTREESVGAPLETAALLANLGFSKVVLDWLQKRNPLALLIAVLPLFVLCCNLLAWALSAFTKRDAFMAHSFRLVLKKL